MSFCVFHCFLGCVFGVVGSRGKEVYERRDANKRVFKDEFFQRTKSGLILGEKVELLFEARFERGIFLVLALHDEI